MNIAQLEAYAKAMLASYLECAAWADAPEDDDDAEAWWILFDQPSVSSSALIDLRYFVKKAHPWLADVTAEEAGHNLWLSRNGHGTGFWDRGFTHGDLLHKIAADMSETYLVDMEKSALN
jgi:hypothetical protein